MMTRNLPSNLADLHAEASLDQEIFGGITGLVSSLYPALVASRKDPAEAMRS